MAHLFFQSSSHNYRIHKLPLNQYTFLSHKFCFYTIGITEAAGLIKQAQLSYYSNTRNSYTS